MQDLYENSKLKQNSSEVGQPPGCTLFPHLPNLQEAV